MGVKPLKSPGSGEKKLREIQCFLLGFRRDFSFFNG
jgi:hypothetical protein